MAPSSYDVIVVGARCAGSATARLLARRGLRTLIVDRATFPSDTVSTHCITTGGCIQLQRWGLFDRVLATNADHVRTFTITFAGMELANPIPLEGDTPGATSPRRTVLDKLLLDAALEAGADAREGITVTELTRDEGTITGVAGRDRDGRSFAAGAALVVGADGVNSVVARHAGATRYHVRESKGAGFYSYFSGWPGEAVELAFADGAGVGVFPTNDGLVCVFAGQVVEEFPSYKKDVERTHRALVAKVSGRLGDWLASSRREERFYAWSAVPGFFRMPYGPGWALVGDAGYHKDPVTGHGITDAFRDAELLANAVVAGLGGTSPIADAMSAYQSRRDEMSLDVYHATQDIAQFAAEPNEMIEPFMRFGAAAQVEALEIAAFGGAVPEPA